MRRVVAGVSWITPLVLALILGACAKGTKIYDDKGVPPSDGPHKLDSKKGDGLPDDLGDTDGTGAGVIYVSAKGTDGMQCGQTPQTACQTITRGIARAQVYAPVRPVLVASGVYNESVVMVEGIDLRGGYSVDFKQGPGQGQSIINGTNINGKAIAVKAENITSTTTLLAFTVKAPNASGAGESSYGVYLEDSPKLVLKELNITAGNGAAGAAGAVGAQGIVGNNGQNGKDGLANLPLPPPFCNSAQAGGGSFYGEGGVAPQSATGACADAGANGGRGEAGVTLVSCDGENGKAATGSSGAVSSCDATSAGKGGSGGKNGEEGCDGGTTKPATSGAGGCPGTMGGDGVDGGGGAALGKMSSAGLYEPAVAEEGKSGTKGSPAGGGGGGGGYITCSGLTPSKWGGGGGGGGSGGCGGVGGGGGGGGGGAFGIFIVKGYTGQIIENCTIKTGKGGAGGKGGGGGPGGYGGAGGAGGKGNNAAGDGGAGGKGGDGGKGGSGGGGGGGPVIGIYIGSGDQPTISGTTYTLGTPGAGGAGTGASNSGATGKSQDLYKEGS